MADLENAFNKLNEKINTSSLNYFICKRNIINEGEKLQKNSDSDEYEWHENKTKKEELMVIIELPYGKEYKWELFGDNNQSESGSLYFDRVMRNRLLTLLIDEGNNNLFLKLYVNSDEDNNLGTLYEKNLHEENILKNEYNCFINLKKKLSEEKNNLTLN